MFSFFIVFIIFYLYYLFIFSLCDVSSLGAVPYGAPLPDANVKIHYFCHMKILVIIEIKILWGTEQRASLLTSPSESSTFHVLSFENQLWMLTSGPCDVWFVGPFHDLSACLPSPFIPSYASSFVLTFPARRWRRLSRYRVSEPLNSTVKFSINAPKSFCLRMWNKDFAQERWPRL